MNPNRPDRGKDEAVPVTPYCVLGRVFFGIIMKTKICSKCKIEKPVSEYYRNKSTKDGLHHWCKACMKIYYQENREERIIYSRAYSREHKEEQSIYGREYRQSHKEERTVYKRKYYLSHREEAIIYNREYSRKHKEKINERSCRYNQNHKEEIAKYQKEYAEKYPERIKARDAAKQAIKSGRLIRPNRCSNPKCNKLCIPDGHHWSYLEEYWLDVEWLCGSCHKRLHVKLRMEINRA